jgi:hypothetical protein
MLPQNIKNVKQLLQEVLKEAVSADKLSEDEFKALKSNDPFYAPKQSALEKRLAMYSDEHWNEDMAIDSEDELENPELAASDAGNTTTQK